MWGDSDVLVRRPVLLDARAQRAAEAVREAAPADVGRGRQPRARSRRPRRWASASSASPAVRPRRWRRWSSSTRSTSSNADPVGDYVNDNVAITTSFMCLEDRDEARDWMTRSGNGRQQTLVFHYLDTFPKPPFVPEWPQEIPDPTLEQIDDGLPSRARRSSGTPDDCAEGLAEVGRHRRRPADHGPVGHRCTRTSCSSESVEAVRRRGHPAVRHRPRALDEPLPPRSGRAPRSRLTRVPTLVRA